MPSKYKWKKRARTQHSKINQGRIKISAKINHFVREGTETGEGVLSEGPSCVPGKHQWECYMS